MVAQWLTFGSNHSSTTVANHLVFIPPVLRVVELWLQPKRNISSPSSSPYKPPIIPQDNPRDEPSTRLAAWSQKRESDLFGSVTFDFGLA
jgi:hypothetical protein